MLDRKDNIWSSTAIVLAVCIILALLVWVLYALTDSQFILGIFGFAVAIVTASMQYRLAKRNEIEARLFTEKREIYEELITTIMSLFAKKGAEMEADEQETLANQLRDIRTKLVIWGSFDTLKSFDKLSETSQIAASEDPTTGLIWLGELFSAIRKDFGHKDPANAGKEIALGMLTPEDRVKLRKTMIG